MTLTDVIARLLHPHTDLRRRLDQAGHLPCPDPDPATVARIERDLRAARSHLRSGRRHLTLIPSEEQQ